LQSFRIDVNNREEAQKNEALAREQCHRQQAERHRQQAEEKEKVLRQEAEEKEKVLRREAIEREQRQAQEVTKKEKFAKGCSSPRRDSKKMPVYSKSRFQHTSGSRNRFFQ